MVVAKETFSRIAVMTRTFRIIPRLDIKKGHLIKGVQMEGWRKVGDPQEFAEKYAIEGADELVFTDVVASLYERNTLQDIVKRAASNIFVPMTIGGGIRTSSDAFELLSCGADKVSLNTAVTRNPSLINEIVNEFGSQACTIAIEAIFTNNRWNVMTDNGRNQTTKEAVSWAREVSDRGAGEILITSISNEGLGKGLNLDLISHVCEASSVPVIAAGGFGNSSHISSLVRETDASGVCIGQALHWNKVSLNEIRNIVKEEGIFVRPLGEVYDKK